MAVSREVASYQGQQEIVDAINGFTLSGVAQKAVWFDSVSSMQRADIPAGATAATRGYTTVNDGGNAFYYIREKTQSDVEDGGSIIFLDNENVAELITNGTVNVKQFGAHGDGSHDDATAIQACFDWAPAGYTVYFPKGRYILRTALNVNKSLNIVGSQQNATGLTCLGCDGIKIFAPCDLSDIAIGTYPRYSVESNNLTSISILGSSDRHLHGVRITNVYCDGFRYAALLDYAWDVVFDRFSCNFGQNGISSRHKSVNNMVTNCAICGSDLENTDAGVGINANTGLDGVVTEGWMISNNLIYGFAFGIRGGTASHVHICNNIIDFCCREAINFYETTGGPSINNYITNNYIACSRDGNYGIHINTATDNFQNKGNSITNNHILTYAGHTGGTGIYMEGAANKYNVITGNHIKGFNYDIYAVSATPNIVANNVCFADTNKTTYALGIISNNIGNSTWRDVYGYTLMPNGAKLCRSTAAPSTGTWNKGDVVLTTNPSAGGFVGWVCVTAGTPGTWKGFGVIEA